MHRRVELVTARENAQNLEGTMKIQVIEREEGDMVYLDVSLNGEIFQTDLSYTKAYMAELKPNQKVLESVAIDEVMRVLKQNVEYIRV